MPVYIDRIAAAKAPERGPDGLLVYRYQLDADAPMSDREKDLLTAFLDRHEVALPGKPAFLDDGMIEIYRQDDGSFDVFVWRAVGGDAYTAPDCPHCPWCVKQERIRVPLKGLVPLLPNATIWPDAPMDSAVADE